MLSAETAVPQSTWQPIKWPQKKNHVPKEIFVRPDVYEQEMKTIFYGKEWHPVAHEGEIPEKGDFKTFSLGQVPLLITRDEAGQVHVMYNACSHRANQLETAPRGNKFEFECPYHRWLFASDGELVGCPAKKGDFPESFKKEDYPLAKPRMAIVHGLIFATLSAETPPINEWMGGWEDQLQAALGGGGKLRLLGYQKVVFKANWKTYHDNDTYHAPLLHQAFRLLNWQGGKGEQRAGPQGHRGLNSEVTVPKQQTLLRDASLIEFRADKRSAGSVSCKLFPITLVITHLNSIGLRFANPLSVNETEAHYAYFGREDDDPEMVRHRIRQASNLLGPCGLVSMEDAAVFHRLHIGSMTPGDAIFQKGVKDENVIPANFDQNDEASNLLSWQYYRKIMGYETQEEA